MAADWPAGSRSCSRLGRRGGRVVALLQLAGTTYRPCGGLSVWCFKLPFFVTSSEECTVPIYWYGGCVRRANVQCAEWRSVGCALSRTPGGVPGEVSRKRASESERGDSRSRACLSKPIQVRWEAMAQRDVEGASAGLAVAGLGEWWRRRRDRRRRGRRGGGNTHRKSERHSAAERGRGASSQEACEAVWGRRSSALMPCDVSLDCMELLRAERRGGADDDCGRRGGTAVVINRGSIAAAAVEPSVEAAVRASRPKRRTGSRGANRPSQDTSSPAILPC